MKNKETIANKLISRLRGLRGLIALLCLAGCSEHPEPTAASMSVEVMSSVADFEEADANTTRAWTPPTNYQLVADNEVIGINFTRNNEEDYMQGLFYKSGSQWRTTIEVDKMTAGTYYLYGYKPHVNGLVCTLTPNTNYSNGTVMTLRNLPTTSPSDLCIVVGAKNGTNADEDGGLTLGDFEYIARAGSGSEGTANNFVFLLFDHLYAAVNFKMKVGSTYAALRTIKLKSLSISTRSSSDTKTLATATVTLTKTSDVTTPISSIVFSQDGYTETGGGIIFYSSAGKELTTTAQSFEGYFMPQDIKTIVLTSTYDVYDKKDNLIRKDCMASNAISIDIFSGQTEARRGCRYNVELTVQPTYLYQLSEPDLNNPTLTVD